MAYERIVGKSNRFKSFSKFEVGESIEGYFTGYSVNLHDNTKLNLNFQLPNEGGNIEIAPAGKLVYLASDLQASKRELIVGAMTKLTRVGSYRPKNGRTQASPTYELLQDPDNVIEVTPVANEEAVVASTIAVSESTRQKVEALKAKTTKAVNN